MPDENTPASGAAPSPETLTVTDNRTGRTYELAITDGAIRAMDLRQIKVSDDDFGLLAYDPAFTNTASCRSAVTFIDGTAGILPLPRHPLEQLAGEGSFLPGGHLLIHRQLPPQEEVHDR